MDRKLKYLLTKLCFTNTWLSYDSQFVIVAWVESWNIFENSRNSAVR